MNAVRIYGSAGNQVFHPLDDDFANLIISHEFHNNFTVLFKINLNSGLSEG